MTPRQSEENRAGAARQRGPVAVLADRMAAALVHHEPGWRLPRLSALARRYNVSTADADAAIEELATRHLVRRLPDGQVYRASPPAYLLPLEGVYGLASQVDPMGGRLACRSRVCSRKRPPEDIRRSLGLAPGERALAIRCLWTVGGEPGALSASYLPERLAAELGESLAPVCEPASAGPGDDHDAEPAPADLLLEDFAGIAAQPPRATVTQTANEPAQQPASAPAGSVLFPWLPETKWSGRPHALQIEMSLPPPSAARSLRIPVGEPVAMVTMSFGDPAAPSPEALTMAILRPELFRIVVQTAVPPIDAGSRDGLASAWTHTMRGWEP
ncbi:MAG TPA: UTRA domain-containing protein [Streptosporangiaceae bacterium]|nr:UTRA domain-containing protein [Streptosporangiaceae bacterium]